MYWTNGDFGAALLKNGITMMIGIISGTTRCDGLSQYGGRGNICGGCLQISRANNNQ